MIEKTLALCLCVLGFAAPVALAQTPSQGGYGETQVLPQPPSPNVPPPPPPPPPSSEVSPNAPSSEVSPNAPSSNVEPNRPRAKVVSPSAPVATSVNSGTLPFTGLNVGIIVLTALVLLGLGVWLRRATATRNAP